MRPIFATETLETRRLLAIAVTGTAAADVIRVASDGAQILVVINGVESRFASDSAGIVVNAGDGADTVRLDDASNLPVTIDGGPLNDRIEVGGGDIRGAHLSTVDVTGGAGIDTLVINDTTAATGNPSVVVDNPIDTYVSIVAAPGTVVRSDASTTASAVEAIIYNGTPFNDVVTVNGTNALATLALNMGNGADAVTVGRDIDSTLKGAVTIDGGAGADAMVFDDSLDSFTDTYFLANVGVYGTLRKNSGGATSSYTNFETMALYAGLGGNAPNNQTFRVSSLPDTTSPSIFAGSGDDTLYLGDGVTSLDTLKASLTFDGQDDQDSIIYNDSLGSDAAAYEVGANYLSNTGTGTLNFLNSESILLTANGASNDFHLTSLPDTLSVTLNGSAGNDTFRIGNGDLDTNIPDGVSIIGGAGSDSLVLDDSADDAGLDTYTIAAGSIRKANMGVLWSVATADQVESIALTCSPNSDVITVTSTTPAIALQIDAGPGDDLIKVLSTTDSTANAATAISIKSGFGRDTLDVNSDNSGSDAIVNLYSQGEDLQDFTIRAGGRVKLSGGSPTVFHVRGVLTLAGPIDIADGTMVVTAGDVNALSALATVGYAGGTWTGNGAAAAILSTTAATATALDAVGVGLADDVGLPVLNGTIPTVAGEVIVRYTLLGDANFDRVVNFDDLIILAQSYNLTGKRWTQGNFNFDAAGTANFDDLVPLAQNYSKSLASLTSAAIVAPVVKKSPTRDA